MFVSFYQHRIVDALFPTLFMHDAHSKLVDHVVIVIKCAEKKQLSTNGIQKTYREQVKIRLNVQLTTNIYLTSHSSHAYELFKFICDFLLNFSNAISSVNKTWHFFDSFLASRILDIQKYVEDESNRAVPRATWDFPLTEKFDPTFFPSISISRFLLRCSFASYKPFNI